MKKLIQSLIAVMALAIVSTAAHADPAPKISVVDMQKLFEGHYKYLAKKAELDGYRQKAQAAFDQMTKDRNALVEQFKELDDKVKSPIASPDEKAKAQSDAQAKGNEIQAKSQDMQQFAADAQRSIETQWQNFHDLLTEEITKIAVDVSKRKGATLLLDKSGRTHLGSLAVLFADSAYDITDDVASEIAKSKPVGGAIVPASAPAAAPTGAPSINVPNVTPASP